MNTSDHETFDKPQRIIRTALGYNFIEEADFFQSRNEISGPFLSLIDDAFRAKRSKRFETLFGKNYKETFIVRRSQHRIYNKYLLFAKKLDERVLSQLDSMGWTKYDPMTMSCESAEKLWHVYMTLLAVNISKHSGEPLSTEYRSCENILRNKLFQTYFLEFLPPQYQPTADYYDLCINFLFNSKDRKSLPLHSILSLQQAAYVRSGLV